MTPVILVASGFYVNPESGMLRRMINFPYGECLADAGGLPQLYLGGSADAAAERADGLLLSGGVDIAPHRYGEEKLEQCGETDERRDEEELALFRTFAERGKPIFGICRGIQTINVALGGTLWQDLESQCGISGHSKGTHEIKAQPGSRAALLGSRYTANSYHHQAVKTPGDGLKPTAWAGDVIEAVEHARLPIWGVQWHPELMLGKAGAKYATCMEMARLFADFVDACRQNKNA